MIIQKQKTYKIDYKKANGENTIREIISLSEIPKNLSALDITDLNELERKYLKDKQDEYNEYVKNYMLNMFDFSTWYEHTVGSQFPKNVLKFKNFTIDNIKILE